MNQTDKAKAFHALHRKGDPIVLYNIWDAGTAKAVADAGAKLLQREAGRSRQRKVMPTAKSCRCRRWSRR